MSSQKISVIIPVLNEENAIAKVIADIPKTVRTLDEKTEATVQEIIVVDNGCTDNTAAIASRNGARVITEPRRGYGSACLAGIAALTTTVPDIVVFLDGDYSDYPTDMPQLLHPILEGKTDFVIGARSADDARDALLPQARFGNWLACFSDKVLLRRTVYGFRSLPSDPVPATPRAEHAGQNLRMDSRDATQSRETGNPRV